MFKISFTYSSFPSTTAFSIISSTHSTNPLNILLSYHPSTTALSNVNSISSIFHNLLKVPNLHFIHPPQKYIHPNPDIRPI
ncbi:hypothetical protein BC829DRAFT_387290, partial [Chytridium lagenaria]